MAQELWNRLALFERDKHEKAEAAVADELLTLIVDILRLASQ
jgi:hypothetical protein